MFHETPVRIINSNLLPNNQTQKAKFFDVIPFAKLGSKHTYIVSGNAQEQNILGWVFDIVKEQQYWGHNILIVKEDNGLRDDLKYEKKSIALSEYKTLLLEPNILYEPIKMVEQVVFYGNDK
jgi:hypothetical protein